MKKVIYILHVDIVDDIDALSNDNIKELHKEFPSRVLRYDNLYDFAYDWNNNYEKMFDPDFSYIRIVEEE